MHLLMARRALGPAQLSLVQAVRPVLEQLGGRLVVGCSGGADSLALTATLAHLAPQAATAIVVDHGLQAGSAERAASVAEEVRRMGIEARVTRVLVREQGQGLEAAAREARLAALLADGQPVWLAHTLDDQAETVLLGLARGSGCASLQGMAPMRRHDGGPLVVRPLLGVRREQTRAACAEWGLEPWDDPMNADPRFRRVRVRCDLLPTLADVLGPGVTEALGRTADLARQDNDLLERLAADSARDLVRGDELDAVGLLHLHPALRGRVLRAWLLDRGVPAPTMQHVQAVAALVEQWRGQRGVDLPGGIRARRSGGVLVAGPKAVGN
ncbi:MULTISPECIES: tRNA lysidine(34) synthetase TilS [unclassified Luteococcus]|uniref:tRNA lysidine(34) synthetase TilS n=1 Tax=unclassified Luteococcus TaxID=2639923 RepID=UPI00313CD532